MATVSVPLDKWAESPLPGHIAETWQRATPRHRFEKQLVVVLGRLHPAADEPAFVIPVGDNCHRMEAAAPDGVVLQGVDLQVQQVAVFCDLVDEGRLPRRRAPNRHQPVQPIDVLGRRA